MKLRHLIALGILRTGTRNARPCHIGHHQPLWIPKLRDQTWGYSLKDYHENPDAMFRVQLVLARYIRFEVDCDHEMGAPEDGWGSGVDFQNVYEAAWLGAPVYFSNGNVPATRPFLTDNKNNLLFDRGIPDAFSRLMGDGLRYLDRFDELTRDFKIEGASVTDFDSPGLGADGPFTLAYDCVDATRSASILLKTTSMLINCRISTPM